VHRGIDHFSVGRRNLNPKLIVDRNTHIFVREKAEDKKHARGLWAVLVIAGIVGILLLSSTAINLQKFASIDQDSSPMTAKHAPPSITATQVSATCFGTTETYIMIDWTRTGDWAFLRYEIWVRPYGGNYGQMNFYITDPDQRYALLSYYVDSGGIQHLFQPGNWYYFVVRDVDSFGYADSVEQGFCVASIPHLVLVANNAQGIEFGIHLTTFYYGSGYYCKHVFVNYQVQRSTAGPSGPWSTIMTITNENDVDWTDSNVIFGQVYYYRVIFNSNVAYISSGTVITNVVGYSDTLGPINANIPEFSTVLVPIIGSMAVIVAAVTIRKKKQT
jgi:hypothetical protein